MGSAPVVSAAMPVVVKMLAKHPILGPMIASEVISKARSIPYVGKLVPPYAEMLPWLMERGKSTRNTRSRARVRADTNTGSPSERPIRCSTNCLQCARQRQQKAISTFSGRIAWKPRIFRIKYEPKRKDKTGRHLRK